MNEGRIYHSIKGRGDDHLQRAQTFIEIIKRANRYHLVQKMLTERRKRLDFEDRWGTGKSLGFFSFVWREYVKQFHAESTK